MESKNKYLPLKLFVLLTFVAMVVVNALSALLPINGVTPAAVSDSYPNLFAPSGITFSIWSVIYILLAAYALYQLGIFQGGARRISDDLLRKIGLLFSVSSLINIAWIFSWHYRNIPLSMLLMTSLLISLLYIALTMEDVSMSTRDKIFVRLPFSIYFGWITVATIANATALLVSLEWNGFGISDPVWTILILLVGALIGLVTLLRFKVISYGLVLIWAYNGILIKHTSVDMLANSYPDVITTLYICLGLFVVTIGYIVLTRGNRTLVN